MPQPDAYELAIRRFHQKDCPLCLDLCYTDSDGLEHIMFDVCQVHLKMGVEELEREQALEDRAKRQNSDKRKDDEEDE